MERLPETKTVDRPRISMENGRGARTRVLPEASRVWEFGGIRSNVSSRQEALSIGAYTPEL
jgi:hypothetical protein